MPPRRQASPRVAEETMPEDQIAGQRTPAVLELIAYDPTEWEAAL